ncbi:glycoside hydrolase family 18 protein [Botryobasidium botryosum FD-172 SS1]|uniref:Glycoside hydrolase family 18 protein n=1 Tax=Botryobasidium botryosum (strain FD-172 SS1) TaxID=930990 RepID=A0A067M5G7_BOTB1|nr:glycoside hydrolase family 18 protein [Botryobasidium botryosum FD-172 SS1]
MHCLADYLLLSLLCLTGVIASPVRPRTPETNGPVATAWYAGYHAIDYPIENIPWDKYTSVTYAFGLPSKNASVINLAPLDTLLLPQFVEAAHKNNVKAKLSLGGWTGSLWYSTNVATADNRTAFTNAIVALAEQYQLDGIDFDWEYPGKVGVGCNAVSPNDTANFLLFLQELRQAVGQDFLLTAAVATIPFSDSEGNPSADVSGFAEVLSYIAIMNYDIFGPFTLTFGPNAPLKDSCASAAAQKQGSATSAVSAWTTAGFPTKQIVLGVPAYGHSVTVPPSAAYCNGTHELVPYALFNASVHAPGDKWDNPTAVDVCGVQQNFGGTFDFWALVEDGWLTSDGKPAEGIDYTYDSCSQTPFIYNSTTQLMISYDDAQSFAAKGQFIKENELLGFSMWEMGGDYNDILLNSIRSAIGF